MTEQVKKSGNRETVDSVPGQSAKGYVEFVSISKDAVVPIYLLDEQRQPHLLAATGLKEGSRYSFRRHPTRVAERVRIALPPGKHQFMIERDGPILQVPVEQGKVTPVDLDYVVLYRGDRFITYRLNYQMFEPGPM